MVLFKLYFCIYQELSTPARTGIQNPEQLENYCMLLLWTFQMVLFTEIAGKPCTPAHKMGPYNRQLRATQWPEVVEWCEMLHLVIPRYNLVQYSFSSQLAKARKRGVSIKSNTLEHSGCCVTTQLETLHFVNRLYFLVSAEGEKPAVEKEKPA